MIVSKKSFLLPLWWVPTISYKWSYGAPLSGRGFFTPINGVTGPHLELVGRSTPLAGPQVPQFPAELQRGNISHLGCQFHPSIHSTPWARKVYQKPMAQFQCFSKCPLKEHLLQFKKNRNQKNQKQFIRRKTSKPWGFLCPLLIQLVEVDVSCFLKNQPATINCSKPWVPEPFVVNGLITSPSTCLNKWGFHCFFFTPRKNPPAFHWILVGKKGILILVYEIIFYKTGGN